MGALLLRHQRADEAGVPASQRAVRIPAPQLFRAGERSDRLGAARRREDSPRRGRDLARSPAQAWLLGTNPRRIVRAESADVGAPDARPRASRAGADRSKVILAAS